MYSQGNEDTPATCLDDNNVQTKKWMNMGNRGLMSTFVRSNENIQSKGSEMAIGDQREGKSQTCVGVEVPFQYSRHLCISKEGGGPLATKGGGKSIDGVRKDNGWE